MIGRELQTRLKGNNEPTTAAQATGKPKTTSNKWPWEYGGEEQRREERAGKWNLWKAPLVSWSLFASLVSSKAGSSTFLPRRSFSWEE